MSSNVGASGTTALAVANPWAVVPSLGNLDAYISAVNRLPMLTARRIRVREEIQGAERP
jgi:RNA polymerase sigma-32 factor